MIWRISDLMAPPLLLHGIMNNKIVLVRSQLVRTVLQVSVISVVPG